MAHKQVAQKTPKSQLPARRDGLHLSVWAGLTLAIVSGAAYTIRNAPDGPRLAAIDRIRTVPDPAQTMEQRRLVETVRALNTERERLATRVAALEESLKDVTASIPRTTDRITVVPRMQPAPPSAAALPQPPAIVRAPEIPEIAAPLVVPDSQLMRSEFAVEIGSSANLDAIRTMWANLKGNHGKLLEGLRPVVGVRDGKPGNVPDLVLRVGPLGNMASAALLCARLAPAAPACRPAIFDGQQLAMR